MTKRTKGRSWREGEDRGEGVGVEDEEEEEKKEEVEE